MGVERADRETDLHFSTTILPLAEIHTQTEQRKHSSRQRIANSWGKNWEEGMGDLLPPWLGETFLRDLMLFAEKKSWIEAEPLFRQAVKERLVIPPTLNFRWLTSRTIKFADGRSRVTEQRATKQTYPPSSLPSFGLATTAASSFLAFYASVTSISATTPTPATTPAPATTSAPALAPTAVSRRNTKSQGDESEPAKKNFKLEITVINLDAEDRIKTIKGSVDRGQDEKKAKDMDCVEVALKGLVGGKEFSGVSKEVWKRRVELLMETLMMEVVEVEE